MDTLGADDTIPTPTSKSLITPAATKLAATPAAAAVAPRRRYDKTCQREAVELWLRSGQPGPQIARRLALPYDRLKKWKRRYHGTTTPIRAELAAANRALKAKLARVCAPRDILKKRWVFSLNHPDALPTHRNHEDRAARGPTLRRPGRDPLRLPCLAARRTRTRACADAALTADLRTIHAEHRQHYGTPHLCHALRSVPRTTQSRHEQPIAPNCLA